MNLTAAQLATLKSTIQADSVLLALRTTPGGADGNQAIADAFNVVDNAFFVYRTNVPVLDIFDQITWANFTPPIADPIDATAAYLNRCVACQGKQFNIQIILQGQSTINASKANVRAGLQDALTNVPGGVAGALVSAGWVSVRDNALARKATRGEKLFATGNGTTAALAATMAVEGAMTGANIEAAFA